MLKKVTLAVAIAASVLGSQIVFAGESKTPVKSEKRIDELSSKIKEQHVQDVYDQVVKVPNVYNLSMTVVKFKLNDKIENVAEKIFNIDDELKQVGNIDKTLEKYGEILSSENYMTNVVEGTKNSTSYTQTIKYVDEVTNGVQSKINFDIMSWQNFYIKNRTDSKLVNVFLDVQSAKLDSLAKYKVGAGSTESFVESPNVSTSAMQQAVAVKLGDYKLVNLGSVVEEGSNNKIYKAVIIKLTEQDS